MTISVLFNDLILDEFQLGEGGIPHSALVVSVYEVVVLAKLPDGIC